MKVGNDNEYTSEEVENPVPEEPHKKEITPYEGTGELGGVKVGDEITYEISYKNYKTEASGCCYQGYAGSECGVCQRSTTERG